MSDKDKGEEEDAIFNVDDFTKGDLYHRKLIGKRIRRDKKRGKQKNE